MILFDKGLPFLEEDSVMYLPFDKSILSNILCSGPVVSLGPLWSLLLVSPF